MSEEKRYMDEEWNDLPLPEGEAAWQKMELLLDKEKKRRRVIPLWFGRYAGPTLLFAALAVGGWLWLKPTPTKNDVISTAREETLRKEPKEKTVGSRAGNNTVATRQNHGPQKQYTHKTTDPAAPQDKLQSHATKEGQRTKRKEASTVQNTTVKAKTSKKTKVKSAHQQLNTDLPQNSISISQQESHTEKAKISPREIEDSLKTGDSLTIVPRPKKDTAALKDTIAKKIAEPMVSNEPKQGSQKKAAFFFSAGVGMQRAIALNSQRSSDFNYKGRRSTVSDLLPSVYLRLQKGKWFAQAEFQYAAPQPVKQFSFSQKTRYDAASLNLNTERFTVQKLYYHQLPFSINYHLLENWSVGAGTVYSILAGAVTEQEVESKNLQTGVANVTRNVAPVQGYRDSFFYKTTAGILVQTDYHWKRFSLGLRFTQNLQPFIKYTKPDGTVLDEKNKVLQAMLRFRLF